MPRLQLPPGLSQGLALVAAMSSALPVAALPPPVALPTAQALTSDRATVERWKGELQGALAALADRDQRTAAKVDRQMRRLYEEMLGRITGGEAACKYFSFVLYLRAIAEARLGRTDDAAWRWQEAQNLSEDLRNAAHPDFPDLAEFLRENLISAERWDSPPTAPPGGAGRPADGSPVVRDGLTLIGPQALKKVKPEYPAGLESTRVGGETLVECVIDEHGVPRRPLIAHSCGTSGFDVAAMEALKEWRYRPARVGGSPVKVLVTVTFRYVAR